MVISKDSFIKIYFLLTFITSTSPLFSYGQQIKIDPEQAVLNINQDLVISLSVPFQKKVRLGNFPEIADFSKKQTVYSREDSLIIIHQHYRPRKTGTFHLPPFSILIDDQTFSYKQNTFIKVSPAQAGDSLPPPMAASDQDEDFIPYNIDAKLIIDISSREIYPGETVSLRVYLHVQRTGDAEFNFIDVPEQLNRIKKTFIPDNSASELINFGSITIDTLTENNSYITRYLLLDALIAPLGTSDIKLGPASFSLLTYSRRKSAGLIEREDFILNLQSSPASIRIIHQETAWENLTPGVFSLSEKISTEKIESNKSIVYEFTIQGNVNNLFNSPPIIRNNDLAKVLPIHKYKKVHNGHSYSFYIVPYRSGNIALKDLLYWPYFNTTTHQPDTLWPSKKIMVTSGNQSEKSNYKNDPFYKKIDSESNKLRSLQSDNMLKLFINLVILFMFAVTVILIIRK